MTEKKLRRLGREALIELLIEQTEENERLTAELAKANEQLQNREITIQNAGSIAEAALLLNDVFLAAERAAAEYVENVARLSAENGKTPQHTKREDPKTLRAPSERAEKIGADTVSETVADVDAAANRRSGEAARRHAGPAKVPARAVGKRAGTAKGPVEAVKPHGKTVNRYFDMEAFPDVGKTVDLMVDTEKMGMSDYPIPPVSKSMVDRRFDEVFTQMKRRNR